MLRSNLFFKLNKFVLIQTHTLHWHAFSSSCNIGGHLFLNHICFFCHCCCSFSVFILSQKMLCSLQWIGKRFTVSCEIYDFCAYNSNHCLIAPPPQFYYLWLPVINWASFFDSGPGDQTTWTNIHFRSMNKIF